MRGGRRLGDLVGQHLEREDAALDERGERFKGADDLQRVGPGCVDVVRGDAHGSQPCCLQDGGGGVGEEDAVPPLGHGPGDAFAIEVRVDEVDGVVRGAEAEVRAGQS